MVIDTHVHIIVPEITRQEGDGSEPRVYWEGERQVSDFAGKQIKSAVRELVHIERILEAQADAGVDHVLLCPWVSILRYDAPAEKGLRVSRIENRALGGLAEKYERQVSALGSVPQRSPMQSRMLLA